MKQHEAGWRCPECKLVRGPDLIDPCLSKLSGVKYACCGHGGKAASMGYIYFESGVTIRFERLYRVEKERADGSHQTIIENLTDVDFTPLVRQVQEDER